MPSVLLLVSEKRQCLKPTFRERSLLGSKLNIEAGYTLALGPVFEATRNLVEGV
jgi:hypothetical protein